MVQRNESWGDSHTLDLQSSAPTSFYCWKTKVGVEGETKEMDLRSGVGGEGWGWE